MYIRIYNARILTMIDNEDIFEGEIHIKDDRIVYIGEKIDTKETFDKEIDAQKNLIMPGFKNAHTHSGMSVLRSLADDLPLAEWLNNAIFPIEAKMSAEDIYEFTKLSVLEYLTSGITACFDMYLTPFSIADSMNDMGFRCVQVGAMNNFSQNINLLEECFNKLNKEDSLQTYKIGFHAEYTTSLDNMKAIADLAKKYKQPIYLHLAETESEVEGCIERYGKRPLKLLDDLGMFDYGGGIFHGVHMTEEDFNIMKKRGLCVVTNPSSNIKLASGICPVSEYLKRGIMVAIGTDGPASNNCLDMFREMFLVSSLTKYIDGDAASCDALEVLKMATVNGAKCMGLDDCDVLAVGKKADIIMIDLNMPNMQPINNISKNIVYSGSKINVKMTMINGTILYLDGNFYTSTSPKEIYDKVESIKQRIIV